MASTAQIAKLSHEWDLGGVPTTFTDYDKAGVAVSSTLKVELELSGNLANGDAFELPGAEILVAVGRFIDFGEFFYPRGTSPKSGFFLILPAAPVVGTTYDCKAVNLGDLQNSLGIWTLADRPAQVVYDSATTCTIEIRLKPFEDFGEYDRTRSVKHSEMFLRTSPKSVKPEQNSVDSVYNSEKALGVHVNIRQGNEQVRYEEHFPARLRFWNQDLNGSEVSDLLTVTLERGVDTVEELSDTEDTTVKLSFPKPAGLQIDAATSVVIWKVPKVNADDWYEDMEYSEAGLFMVAFPVQIVGLIYGPAENFSLVGGNYEAYFTVPGAVVDRNFTYRIGVLAFFDSDPGGVFQYAQPLLAPPFAAAAPPPPCSWNVFGSIENYDEEYATTVLEDAAPGDRYKLKTRVNKLIYDTCGNFWEDIQQFVVRTYEEGEDPALNPIDIRLITFNGGIPEDEGDFEISEDASEVFINFPFRAPILNDQANLDDFGGKTINFECNWVMTRDGETTVYRFIFTITFSEYDNDLDSPDYKIESITYYDADTGRLTTGICDLERLKVLVQLEAGHGSNGSNIRFRTLTDREPFGLSMVNDMSTIEHDAYASPEGFEQKLYAYVESQDEYFDSLGRAFMILNMNQFGQGQVRRLYAIQNKLNS